MTTEEFRVGLLQEEAFRFRASFDGTDAPPLIVDEPAPIGAEAHGTLVRNEQGRWRIGSLAVTLRLTDTTRSLPAPERCLRQFEDLRIVTQSVRAGIAVAVRAIDGEGRTLAADVAVEVASIDPVVAMERTGSPGS